MKIKPSLLSTGESVIVAWMACRKNRAPQFFPDEKEAFLLCGTSEWTITPVYSHHAEFDKEDDLTIAYMYGYHKGKDSLDKEAVRNAALEESAGAIGGTGMTSIRAAKTIRALKTASVSEVSQPAQPSKGQLDQFEEWAIQHGEVDLTRVDGSVHKCENGWFPATYVKEATETAWRAYANKKQPAQPSDTEMLDWMLKNNGLVELRGRQYYCGYGPYGTVLNGALADSPREAIKAAMKSDKERP